MLRWFNEKCSHAILNTHTHTDKMWNFLGNMAFTSKAKCSFENREYKLLSQVQDVNCNSFANTRWKGEITPRTTAQHDFPFQKQAHAIF